MKLSIALIVATVLAAGPAAAQGTFNNGQKPKTFGTPAPAGSTQGGYALPGGSQGGASRQPGSYAAPADPGGFKPYGGFKGSSVYTAPKPPSPGAKPCETSVYVNACDKAR
jgi:hypothetical protein